MCGGVWIRKLATVNERAAISVVMRNNLALTLLYHVAIANPVVKRPSRDLTMTS